MTARDHSPDLRDFWQRLQTGVATAVVDSNPEKLLGVRDGMLRYFREALRRDVPVAVVPQSTDEPPVGLPISDAEILSLARQRVDQIAERLGDEYHFYTASEGGVQAIELDGRTRWFLRAWTVVRSPVGEACGGSGAVELPERLVAGLAEEQIPFAVPGTRRGGGIMSALTGGLENRRRATALATTNALSTLFYGILETRAGHHG